MAERVADRQGLALNGTCSLDMHFRVETRVNRDDAVVSEFCTDSTSRTLRIGAVGPVEVLRSEPGCPRCVPVVRKLLRRGVGNQMSEAATSPSTEWSA